MFLCYANKMQLNIFLALNANMYATIFVYGIFVFF
jgi:hypothetical protein